MLILRENHHHVISFSQTLVLVHLTVTVKAQSCFLPPVHFAASFCWLYAPRIEVQARKKHSVFHVCFFDHGSVGKQAGTETRRKATFWLPDWQEVKVSVSFFKPQPITSLRLVVGSFFSPSKVSYTKQ